VKGIINLRGEVIPVIDLREKFGLAHDQYSAADQRGDRGDRQEGRGRGRGQRAPCDPRGPSDLAPSPPFIGRPVGQVRERGGQAGASGSSWCWTWDKILTADEMIELHSLQAAEGRPGDGRRRVAGQPPGPGPGRWGDPRPVPGRLPQAGREFHPDVNHCAGAVRRFREVTEAYRALEELWRMKEAAESRDLFQAVLLDPLFARISTGRLKSRLRRCPLWQVRASAAAALGLRGEENSCRSAGGGPPRLGRPGARGGAPGPGPIARAGGPGPHPASGGPRGIRTPGGGRPAGRILSGY